MNKGFLDKNVWRAILFMLKKLYAQPSVSHLRFQLFEPHIHSWPALCHLLLQPNQLLLPRAHISAELGDSGVTPDIIGGEAERGCWMRMERWMRVKERCEDREMAWKAGENSWKVLQHNIQCSDRLQTGGEMETKWRDALIKSVLASLIGAQRSFYWILNSPSILWLLNKHASHWICVRFVAVNKLLNQHTGKLWHPIK